jgi:hypothetical protein
MALQGAGKSAGGGGCGTDAVGTEIFGAGVDIKHAPGCDFRNSIARRGSRVSPDFGASLTSIATGATALPSTKQPITLTNLFRKKLLAFQNGGMENSVKLRA